MTHDYPEAADDFEALAREVDALEGVRRLRVAGAAVPRMRALDAKTRARRIGIWRPEDEEQIGTAGGAPVFRAKAPAETATIEDAFKGLLRVAQIEAEVQDGQRAAAPPSAARAPVQSGLAKSGALI